MVRLGWNEKQTYRLNSRPQMWPSPMRKKLATMTAHCELTVTKMVTASCDWAVTWAVIELWPNRDWVVIILKMPWLSCDLAVTELWPLLAVTEPWSLGPQSRDHHGHGELTVTIYFLMGRFDLSHDLDLLIFKVKCDLALWHGVDQGLSWSNFEIAVCSRMEGPIDIEQREWE